MQEEEEVIPTCYFNRDAYLDKVEEKHDAVPYLISVEEGEVETFLVEDRHWKVRTEMFQKKGYTDIPEGIPFPDKSESSSVKKINTRSYGLFEREIDTVFTSFLPRLRLLELIFRIFPRLPLDYTFRINMRKYFREDISDLFDLYKKHGYKLSLLAFYPTDKPLAKNRHFVLEDIAEFDAVSVAKFYVRENIYSTRDVLLEGLKKCAHNIVSTFIGDVEEQEVKEAYGDNQPVWALACMASAFEANESSHTLAETLIKRYGGVNELDKKGKSPLYHAISKKDWDLVYLLQKNGADGRDDRFVIEEALRETANPKMIIGMINAGAPITQEAKDAFVAIGEDQYLGGYFAQFPSSVREKLSSESYTHYYVREDNAKVVPFQPNWGDGRDYKEVTNSDSGFMQGEKSSVTSSFFTPSQKKSEDYYRPDPSGSGRKYPSSSSSSSFPASGGEGISFQPRPAQRKEGQGSQAQSVQPGQGAGGYRGKNYDPNFRGRGRGGPSQGRGRGGFQGNFQGSQDQRPSRSQERGRGRGSPKELGERDSVYGARRD